MLVKPDDIGSLLKITPSIAMVPHIQMAEALISSELGGSIYERDVISSHYMRYLLTFDDVVELPDGPISSMTAMTLDGGAAPYADLILGSWTVRRPDGFSLNQLVGFSYKAGWTAANVPFEIKQAIIGVAAELHMRPRSDLQSESIGDYSYTVKSSNNEHGGEYALSPRTRLLLRRWKRPMI